MNPADRPLAILKGARERHPKAWDFFAVMREARGTPGLVWPDWCFAPVSLALEFVEHSRGRAMSGSRDTALVTQEAAVLTALAAWRMSKGIYVFDPDLQAALTSTSLDRELPVELLQRMPEWCVYVALPDLQPDQSIVHGAWVHLNTWDEGRTMELRFVLNITRPDGMPGVLAVPVDLTAGTLKGGIASVLSAGPAVDAGTLDSLHGVLEATLNLTLYLCSEQPDYSDREPPGLPETKRVKGQVRVFAPHGPTIVPVGTRIGAIIREGRAARARAEDGSSDRTRPVPHVRAAHWHLYWTGPKTERQTPVIKWIAPTLVNADAVEELPAVIRRVTR